MSILDQLLGRFGGFILPGVLAFFMLFSTVFSASQAEFPEIFTTDKTSVSLLQKIKLMHDYLVEHFQSPGELRFSVPESQGVGVASSETIIKEIEGGIRFSQTNITSGQVDLEAAIRSWYFQLANQLVDLLYTDNEVQFDSVSSFIVKNELWTSRTLFAFGPHPG